MQRCGRRSIRPGARSDPIAYHRGGDLLSGHVLLNGGGPARDNLRRFAREVMPAFSRDAKVLVAG